MVILSTADMRSPVWTNKQHLACGLAEHMPVTYIESLGLREPRLRRADVSRVVARLRRTTGSKPYDRPIPAAALERLKVVGPTLLPFHRYRLARWINRRLLERAAERSMPELSEAVLWTFSPMTYGLEERSRATVYHSVDLLHTFPGVPSRALLEAETRLLQVANVVIASSAGVADHLRSLGRDDVLLWENVADTQLFSEWSLPWNERLPRAIFAGNLTYTKVDVDLLLALADRGLEVAVAGPMNIDGTDASTGFATLSQHPRVTLLGNLGPKDLAREVGRSRAGLIPYLVNDHTAGVFPMKVFEYLAGGLQVCSTPLRSLAGVQVTGLEIAARADFVDVVGRMIHEQSTDLQSRQDEAMPHSWKSRVEAASDMIATLDRERA